MSELVERLPRAGGFLVSEAPGTRSRSTITVAMSALLRVATVVAIADIGALTAVGAASLPAPVAATITPAPVVAGGTKLGGHRFECIVGGAGAASKWRHTDPDGDYVGVALGNTQYVGGGLTLTITDAGTDPVAGEAFMVTVTAGEASNKYKQLNPTATDGTQIAAAILYDEVDATEADQKAVVIDCDAEVVLDDLVWPDGITEDQIAAALDQLRWNGIKALAAV